MELLVSRHRPERVSRDMIRPVCVMRRVEESAADCRAGSSAEDTLPDQDIAGDDERSKFNKIGSSAETRIPGQDTAEGNRRPKSNKISSSAETISGTGHTGEIVLEQRLKLGFTVSPEFLDKYNKIKSLLSNKYPEGINFETLFDMLMDEYLDKHDPDKRRERRAKRARSCNRAAGPHPEKTRAGKADSASNRDKARRGGCKTKIKKPGSKSRRTLPAKRPAHNSRYIPTAIRDRVYARDNGKCTFVGANGRRCNSTWDLEIDHVVPFAQGGDNSPGNLRLLCRKHNSYQAERAYGKEFMKNYR